MSAKVTPRQFQILMCIRYLIETDGLHPTVEDVSRGVSCSSPGGARSGIAALVKKGLVRQRPRVARGISLTPEGEAAAVLSCPPTDCP